MTSRQQEGKYVEPTRGVLQRLLGFFQQPSLESDQMVTNRTKSTKKRSPAARSKDAHNAGVISDAQAQISSNNFHINFQAKTEKQRQLYKNCLNNPLVIANGPAGTGKSYGGLAAALTLLSDGRIDQIVLTRNPLPTGMSVGFFKGSDEEKMEVWLAPALGTIKKLLRSVSGSDGMFNYLRNAKKIVLQPMETVKGSSYDRTFIHVEEAQECSLEQLRNLSTRVGTDSTIFFNGDVSQANSTFKGAVDYKRFVSAIESYNVRPAPAGAPDWARMVIPVTQFTKSDCVRSDVTRLMLEIFETEGLDG